MCGHYATGRYQRRASDRIWRGDVDEEVREKREFSEADEKVTSYSGEKRTNRSGSYVGFQKPFRILPSVSDEIVRLQVRDDGVGHLLSGRGSLSYHIRPTH